MIRDVASDIHYRIYNQGQNLNKVVKTLEGNVVQMEEANKQLDEAK